MTLGEFRERTRSQPDDTLVLVEGYGLKSVRMELTPVVPYDDGGPPAFMEADDGDKKQFLAIVIGEG